MKKFTYVLLMTLIVFTLSAAAQVQTGNVLIGGNLAGISAGLNKPNVFSIDLTPKAAWFIQDNLALGGYVNFGIQTAQGASTVTSYGVGGLGRYYAGSDISFLKHARIFGEATLGVGGQNVSAGGGSTNGLDFSFGPGFTYFVSRSIGLETLFKYNGLGGFGNVGYQNSLNLSFGLQIYLPVKSTVQKVVNDIN